MKVYLRNFIKDCYAGDVNNGTSTAHVKYDVAVVVDEYSNNQYKRFSSRNVSSSTGADKSQIDVPIDVPSNYGFRIKVTVAATECSKCSQSFCNNFRISENGNWYVVSAGKPYWNAEVLLPRSPATGIILITPEVAPRFPNSSPPEDCSCKIKDN